MIYKLFKILSSNFFSFSGTIENLKKGPKEIVKNIFLILLMIYAFGVIAAMYVIAMLGVYSALALVGETALMPVIALLLSAFLVFFFGFTSVASNYYTGNGEEQLLSMPFTPGQLFGAKFAVSFVTDAVFGLVAFAIAAGIYGFNQHILWNPMFYIGTIVTALAFTSIAVAVIYFLFIVVLHLFPGLRKKSILNGIATFFVIAFVIGFSFANQKLSISLSLSDIDAVQELMAPNIEKISSVSESIPFIVFLADAVHGKILPILVMLAIFAAVVFGLVPLMGKFYISSLRGFSDVKSKKLSSEKVTQVINKDVQSKSIFSSLFWRDIKTVFREPTFFANGPLMVILLPVIMLVSMSIGFMGASDENVIQELREDIYAVFNEDGGAGVSSLLYYVSLIGGAFAVFMGNSSNIAVSAFSREGKAIYDLKAMPIQNNIIAKVKFAHSFVYTILADVVISLLVVLISVFFQAPVTVSQLVSVFVGIALINLPISLVLIFVDLFIDTSHPKLQWENPVAAFKQNLNAVLAVFITMGVAALVVVLGIFLLPKNQVGTLILAAFFGIIAAVLGAAYFRYAEKRISTM